jgi:hypothetical protein
MNRLLSGTLDRTHPAGSASSTAAASSGSIALALDAVALVVSAALVVVLASGEHFLLRPTIALVFVLFVPGWTIIRAFGAPATWLSVIGSIALSLSVTMILGECLVLFGDWKWFPLGMILGAACAYRNVISVRAYAHQREVTGILQGAVRPVSSPMAKVTIGSVAVGGILVLLGLRRTTIGGVDLLGLFDVLSVWYWLGLAVILGGLVVACARTSRWAWVSVSALLVALHGLPGLLEPNPRFSVAWTHVGFAGQIADHGTLLRSLDARFSWAGFFAGGGLLQRFAGTESLLWLVRFAPLFYNACAVVLVVLLARRLRATHVQSVVAATLFCCLNWIAQDYFAPQATALVLYLAVIVVVLTVFPADPAGMGPRLKRLLRPEPDTTEGICDRQAVWVLAGCCLLVMGLVISHQLTPGFLLGATILLALCGATRLKTFPVLVAVMFLAWLSFGAAAYWVGHLDTLTRSVGQVGTLLDQNVGRRTRSSELGRQVVVGSRIVLAVVAWGAAALAIVLSWRKHRTPVALLCLFVAPFGMLLLQSYGGEMVLRVCYFTLPPVSILIARLLVPSSPIVSLKRVLASGAVIAVLIPFFVLARFGNESFESFSDADIQPVSYTQLTLQTTERV